tara:strand:+ start:580 stop:3849 length:3270 start_codon:yes stop_codon:yes gene_type:complete
MATILRAINDDGVKYDLDLQTDLDFKLDISAIESGNIGKVFGVSSQQFSLPPSEVNNEFFGNLYDIGATPSTSFIKAAPCQVLQNGIEIFSGKLYLENVVTDNMGNDIYNVVVVNETVDFNLLLKDTTFGDLDFQALNHTYSYGNITSSWDGGLVDGAIFYPLVNYGFDEENPLDTQIKGGGEARTFTNPASPIRIDDFKPAIRIRECLDAIFDLTNYEYTSSLFTSGSEIDTLYMLATKDDKKGISAVSPVSQSFRAFTTSSQDYLAPVVADPVFFGGETFDNANNFDGTKFTVGADGTYQFELNLVYEILNYNAINDNRAVDIRITKNGSNVIDLYNFDLTGTIQGQMNVVTQYYALVIGDTIGIQINFTKGGTGAEELRIIASNNSRFKLLQGPTTALGGNVDISQVFDNISVPAFLQGLIEKFNLIIEPVKNERNVLSIETFNEWVDQGEVVNWTDKVDYNKKWSISHPLQGQPKNITFNDVEDNIVLSAYHKRTTGKTYGVYDYVSESDLALGDKQIGSFFAPTPFKGIPGSPQTVMPGLAEKDDSSQPFKRFNFSPRLLFRKPTRQPASGLIARTSGGAIVQNRFYFKDENGVNHIETDYGLASHLQDLPSVFGQTLDIHFGNNWSPGHYNYHQPQFNGVTKRTAFYEYWAFYINELYDVDSRKVVLNIFLKPNEIPQISLNNKIFIDGHYYRINKISGANVTREASVEVELLKTLPRKLYFPRRRITTLDDIAIDITVDDAGFTENGFVLYEDFESGAAYTGSALALAATRDGFDTYGTDVVWNTQKPVQVKFDTQTNIGLNRVAESSETIDTRGDNNVVENNVSTARVEGSDNTVESYARFVQVSGIENNVARSVENSSIVNSNTSSLDTGTTLSTIIAGNDTHISASNNSAVIGPQVTLQGGGESVVIGNGTDNTDITVNGLFNIVALNPNRDLNSIENLGGDDFNTYAYIGSYRRIGAVFSDYLEVTGSAGGNLDMRTDPAYKNTYYHFCSWTGGNGDYTIYLPSTAASPPGGIDQPIGYKREMKFFSDTSLTSNTNIILQPSGSDNIEGTTSYTIDKPLEGLTIFGTPGNWYIVQLKA